MIFMMTSNAKIEGYCLTYCHKIDWGMSYDLQETRKIRIKRPLTFFSPFITTQKESIENL